MYSFSCYCKRWTYSLGDLAPSFLKPFDLLLLLDVEVLYTVVDTCHIDENYMYILSRFAPCDVMRTVINAVYCVFEGSRDQCHLKCSFPSPQ